MKKPDGSIVEPIYTISKRTQAKGYMKLPINSACTVSIGGERVVHSYVTYEFSKNPGATLSLVARTRQFRYAFILLHPSREHPLHLPCLLPLRPSSFHSRGQVPDAGLPPFCRHLVVFLFWHVLILLVVVSC